MATTIHEFFGYMSQDSTPAALASASNQECPFLAGDCRKTLHDGKAAGVCTLKPAQSGPVICCPVRLYANNYAILDDIAATAFGSGVPLYPGNAARGLAVASGSPVIAVFGKDWGGELHLPQRAGSGSYFVDWILARLDANGSLRDFVAVEVQSIDTTGNYRDGRSAMLNGRSVVPTTAGFNWENVSKRILPQLLYKGHVLQRENLCTKGLFFVSPTPVHEKIMQRLGGIGALASYPMQSSSITFMAYDLDQAHAAVGTPAPLIRTATHTTNITQVAAAFSMPTNLPPMDAYRGAIEAALT